MSTVSHVPHDQDSFRRNLLTVAEVAEVMRMSRMSVYRLIQSGELSSLRVGRSYRVPAAALDLFLVQADYVKN